MDIQHDQDKSSHADGQAENVDKGSDFIVRRVMIKKLRNMTGIVKSSKIIHNEVH
jgi:hypothetical protein